MSPKTEFKSNDPRFKKQSVALRRHEKHTRHPHTILGAIAPDAAPDAPNPEANMPPPEPPKPPLKPVDEILPTALPAEESYSEAAIVAQAAFHPRYVVPSPTVDPNIYGPQPAVVSAENPSVVPEATYDVAGKSPSKSSPKWAFVIIGLLLMIILGLVTVVVVLASTKK